VPFAFFPEDSSAAVAALSFDELSASFVELFQDSNQYDLAVDLRVIDDTRRLLKLVPARSTAGFDPFQSYPWLTIAMHHASPTREGRAERHLYPAPDFRTGIGDHRSFEIRFDEGIHCGDMQFLLNGPYSMLKAGSYEMEVSIEPLKDDFELLYDLVVDRGERTLDLGCVRVRRNARPVISLISREPLNEFEFRLRAKGEGPLPPFRFLGIEALRHGFYAGTHQREAMALLAHLVGMRLRHPYAKEFV
jgi:hypothetical protein